MYRVTMHRSGWTGRYDNLTDALRSLSLELSEDDPTGVVEDTSPIIRPVLICIMNINGLSAKDIYRDQERSRG